MPGRGGARALEQEHPALDRAAVLAARDDFLARVAALLEVDAADQLEIEHLRHEPIDRRGLDPRDAAAHLEPAPVGRVRRSGRRLPRRPRGARHPIGRFMPRTAPHRRSRQRPHDEAARGLPRRAGGSERAGRLASCPRRHVAETARAAASPTTPVSAHLVAGIARACIARAARTSRDASASAPARPRRRPAAHRRRRSSRRRSSPASGPLPSRIRPVAPARAERGDVVGELALQELRASAPRARMTPRWVERHGARDRLRACSCPDYHQRRCSSRSRGFADSPGVVACARPASRHRRCLR